MNKNDLVAQVASETNLTKADCQRVIEATLEITKKCIKDGEEVRLVGFGTFLKTMRKERRGVNPQTGKEMIIQAQAVPRFRAGRDFKEFIA